jgi:cytidylate kinase
MAVITIARQFGAGGSDVAGIVAQRLGAAVVDKSLIAEVAGRLAVETGDVEAEDEHPSRLVDRLVRAMTPMALEFGAVWDPPYVDPSFDPRKAVIELTRQIIRDVASRGNAVIVGRGGAFVLADMPDALHVYLCAPLERRVATVMGRFELNEAEARRRVHETDANREAYAHQLFGADWGDPVHYDLVLNTARLGYEGAAEVILSVVARRAAG